MIDKDDPRITAYVLGELSPEEMAEIENAIQQNPDLQAEVEEISQMCGTLTSAFTRLARKEDSPKLSDDQRSEVLACADQSQFSEDNGMEGEDSSDKELVMKIVEESPPITGRSSWRTLAQLALGLVVIAGAAALIWPAGFMGNGNIQSFSLSSDQEPSANEAKDAPKYYERSDRGLSGWAPGGALGDKGKKRLSPAGDKPLLIAAEEEMPNMESHSFSISGVANGKSNVPVDGLSLDVDSDGERRGYFRNSDGQQGLGTAPIRLEKEKSEEFDDGKLSTVRNVWPDRSNRTGSRFSGVEKRFQEAVKELQSGRGGEQRSGEQKSDEKLADVPLDRAGSSGGKGASGPGRDTGGERNPSKNVADLYKIPGASQKGKDKQIATGKTNGQQGKEIRKSWKRVRATPNATRLVVGQDGELRPSGMQMDVQIDGFRARVVVDYLFYNPYGRQLEGQFKMRLPDGSSPYYFAFGESRYDFTPVPKNSNDDDIAKNFVSPGPRRFVNLSPELIRTTRKDTWSNVKEARMVPRAKAAFAYKEVTRRRVDPAIVEWAGAGVFDAKVFPLAPRKMHRIVMGYDVDLRRIDDKWVLDLELPAESGLCQFDCRVTTTDKVTVAPKLAVDKFENTALFHSEDAKAGRYRISIPVEEGLVLYSGKRKKGKDFQSARGEKDIEKTDQAGSYFATSVKLPIKSEDQTASKSAIFLLDTSLSSRPDKFNLWLKLMDSILEKNEKSLQKFAVLHFDVQQRWWKEEFLSNNDENRKLLRKYCDGLSLEGATDIESAFRKLTENSWLGKEKKRDFESSSRPDVFLLSDGAVTWGQKDVRMMKQRLSEGKFGRLFAYQTGLQGTAIRTLRYLAGSRGGAVFSIANEKEIELASTAHQKNPWELVKVSADGASDVMTAGRIQWLYPGQPIMVVGRGFPEKELTFKVRNGDDLRTITVPVERKERSQLAFRTYGQVAVGQLENLGHLVEKFSTAYARNFRVTGQTCSLLMLESEADYRRFKINPENDRFVVASKDCKEVVEETIRKQNESIASNKAAMWHFLGRLSDAGGSQFKRTTDMELVWDLVGDIPPSKFLSTKFLHKKHQAEGVYATLGKQKPSYQVVVASAKELSVKGRDAQAIRRLSSLVEKSPGNVDLVRDVAFSVMELGRADQAFFLLYDLAKKRPFDGSLYLDMAECLNQMGNPSMALVMNDVAVRGKFSKAGFQKIAAVQFRETAANLKNQPEKSNLGKVWQYAKGRLSQLESQTPFGKADIVVTMGWNTDRTDVDLHVIDPDGESCNYQNTKTKLGGRITRDVTDGYGPEMFWLKSAPAGVYQVKVKYFASDALRKGLSSKVYLKVYRNFGSKNQTVSRKTVTLRNNSSVQSVLQFRVKDE